jgi:Helix-turn-helix domain
MFDPTVNPSVLFDGLFVSYLLLSDHRLSALAKLLYVFLASQASPRGEAVPDVAFLSRVLGAEAHEIYEALNQLERLDYFVTRRDSSGTEFVHCRFVTPPWLKTPAQRMDDESFFSSRRERRRRGRRQQQHQPRKAEAAEVVSIKEGKGHEGGRRRESEFPFEVCLEWGRHCERRGDCFARGVDYFAGWVFKFGEQDEDIRLWLRDDPRGREVAEKYAGEIAERAGRRKAG